MDIPQTSLFIQLFEGMKKDEMDPSTCQSIIDAFLATPKSAQKKFVEDYIANQNLSIPTPSNDGDSDTKLIIELVAKLNAAGITHKNPLYAQYIYDFEQAPNKSDFIHNFSLAPDNIHPVPVNEDEQTIDENEGGNSIDDTWKVEIHDALKKAAYKHTQLYENIPDANNPHNLKFNFYDSQANKDAQRPDGSVVYYDRNHVSLKSQNYNHFLTTVQAAKNAGIKTITFGENIKTLEYKSNLYMACLKLGMEMKNPPAIEDIKGINPKLNYILTMMEMRKDIMTARKRVAELQPQFEKDPECKILLKNFRNAQNAWVKDKDNQDLKDAKNAASKALNENPLTKTFNNAIAARNLSLKKAFDYVVSQKPNDKKATIKQKMENVSKCDTPEPAPTKTLTQKTGESDADFQYRQTRYAVGKTNRDTDKKVQTRRENNRRFLRNATSSR